MKSGPDMLSCLAFDDGCETLVQGHLKSPSYQVVSKYPLDSISFSFSFCYHDPVYGYNEKE